MTLQEAIASYSDHLSGPDANQVFQELMAMDFDPEVHYPMAYLHIHYVMLERAEQLLEKATDKNDQTYLLLYDFLRALAETEICNAAIFPLSVSYREWWNGPHLEFPKEIDSKPFHSWNPARIELVEDSIAYLIAGKLENGKITYAHLEIPVPKLNCQNLEDYEEIPIIEMAFYGEEGFLISKCHPKHWDRPQQLLKLHEIIQPVIYGTNRRVQEFSDSFYQNQNEQ